MKKNKKELAKLEDEKIFLKTGTTLEIVQPVFEYDFSESTWKKTLLFAIGWGFCPLIALISKILNKKIGIYE